MHRAQTTAQRLLCSPQDCIRDVGIKTAWRPFSSGSTVLRERKRQGRASSSPRRIRTPPVSEKANQLSLRQSRKTSALSSVSARDSFPSRGINATIIEKLEEVQSRSKGQTYDDFVHDVTTELRRSRTSSEEAGRIANSLRRALGEQGEAALTAQIEDAYHGYLAVRQFTRSTLQDQAKLTDLRYPVEWYPETRQIQRTIHLHVGPTNSGKTYHALKRLEQAESGVYAGPLRLLAHEVYTRLNAKGKPCHLITGDERRMAEDVHAKMTSCTVEMVPINIDCDVAVIDEIQMIGHNERGWAWTQALLGLKAKELHLCGEERTVPLIRELTAAMGDNFEVHHYQRLSPLKTMSHSLKGDLKALRKGDCVVAFSQINIHRLKRLIEYKTRKRVAIVYGSLPPEIRAQQAALFNDPDNDYDFLVASDAIGMGLNLSIKRIIFSTTIKFDGRADVPIETSQIKQIAGRAGRYRTAAQAAEKEPHKDGQSSPRDQETAVTAEVSPAQNLGLVTTLFHGHLRMVQKAMHGHADPIMTAGVFPPTDVIVRFAAYFPPSTPFSYILLRLHKISLIHPRFHLCILKDHIGIADTIEPVKNLTTADRILFCAAPAKVTANTRDDAMRSVVRSFAECVGNGASGGILDIPVLNLTLLNEKVLLGSKDYLGKLEFLHKALVLYLWLSYRFAGVFNTQAMAFYVKGIVEDRIQQVLAQVPITQKEVPTPRTTKIWQPGSGFEIAKNWERDDADNKNALTPGGATATKVHGFREPVRRVLSDPVNGETLPQLKDDIHPGIIDISPGHGPIWNEPMSMYP
ncbi:MAG: hypothetical protein Q9218_004317 [Villophora microphyllina]